MIEIMIAVVVTAIGFAAIFSLQMASIQGNIAAREMGAAVNLAERHLEVLRRDAYSWTSGERPGGERLGAELDTWHTLTTHPVDHNGRKFVDDDGEFGSDLARQRFCVHYYLEPLAGAVYDGVLGVRVRVVWPRATLDPVGLDDVCASPDQFRPDVATWFTLSVPATLRRHPKS